MLIDISPLVDPSIHVWPGDTPFVHTVNLDMHKGANLTLSDIRTTVHVGAHADAPNHYVADGDDIAARRLDLYIGRCVVVRVDVERGEPQERDGRPQKRQPQEALTPHYDFLATRSSPCDICALF